MQQRLPRHAGGVVDHPHRDALRFGQRPAILIFRHRADGFGAVRFDRAIMLRRPKILFLSQDPEGTGAHLLQTLVQGVGIAVGPVNVTGAEETSAGGIRALPLLSK